MTHLTVEEIYLLKTLNCADRQTALHEAKQNEALTLDKELQMQYRQLTDRLSVLSDEEFKRIDLNMYTKEDEDDE